MTGFSGHTPGPWAVEDPMGFELSIVEGGKAPAEWRFIASLTLPGDGVEEPDADFPEQEIRANAALIAAAPDLLAERDTLLAALQAVRNECLPAGNDWGNSKIVRICDAAVAKVRAP